MLKAKLVHCNSPVNFISPLDSSSIDVRCVRPCLILAYGRKKANPGLHIPMKASQFHMLFMKRNGPKVIQRQSIVPYLT